MPRQEPGEPYYRVDSNEARAILDADTAGTVVVDVRRDDEWITGHIAGARHIPIDDLADRIDEVPRDKRLLFICAMGVRSGLACEVAASMGYATENTTTSRMALRPGSPPAILLPTALTPSPHPFPGNRGRAKSNLRS